MHDDGAVRVLATSSLLTAVVASVGCSGFSIGVRQDKADRESLARVLAAQRPGSRLRAGALLPRP